MGDTEKNTLRLFMGLITLILIGLTLQFLLPEYNLIMPAIVPILILVIAIAIVFETQLARALKMQPELTAHRIGAYLVAALVVLLAVIGLAGLFSQEVPEWLAPYAGTITGLGAIVTIALMKTKKKLK